LKKIRKALTQSTPLPFPKSEGTTSVFKPAVQELEIFCKETEIGRQLKEAGFADFHAVDLEGCDAAITGCEFLIARTGSIVMSSAQKSGRTVSVYAPVHICIAKSNQLVYDVRNGIEKMKEKYGIGIPSMITFASGPSRTADIEKTLVVGVHGPKEVFVFLVDEI